MGVWRCLLLAPLSITSAYNGSGRGLMEADRTVRWQYWRSMSFGIGSFIGVTPLVRSYNSSGTDDDMQRKDLTTIA